ncbi:MAG TPA: hypothetical protein VHN20_03990, partial [Beijerinckiaceae bacterium]|nr:hypothetical protein [Beijerinckiaceae bacterium]
MSLQSRGTRPKNWPDAQHQGASRDHRVHVPSSAERRRIRKARARRRVLTTLAASLLTCTALTAGAFIFPETAADVVKAVDRLQPGAGWTAMFPEKSAPAPVVAAASEKPEPRVQPWRTAQAQKVAAPGPSKPAVANPTETASVSIAKERIREFDWLPDRPIEAADGDAAFKLRATLVSPDAASTAAVPLASAGEPLASRPGATTQTGDATPAGGAAATDKARASNVRTVTTTAEAGVAMAKDAAAFKLGAAAAEPETFVTAPDAHRASTPDLSTAVAATETAPLPEPVPANDPPAPTSVVAAAAEAATATAAAEAAPPDSIAATAKSAAVPVAVATAIATAPDTPVVLNLAVKTEVAALAETPTAAAPRARAAAKGPTATEVAEMIKRARARLDIGDIAGARLLLERAASGNDPNALMALAETYDPAMLSRLGVRGPKGDPA